MALGRAFWRYFSGTRGANIGALLCALKHNKRRTLGVLDMLRWWRACGHGRRK